MKPTAIWITGSYDALADEPGDGTNFINCVREVATHISVYLAEDHEIEPVQDFPLKPGSAKAYADALTLAAGLAHEKTLPIRDTYQNNFFRAPAYPQVEQRYCVDGAVYPNDENGPLFQGDGQYPPFVIFDIQGQKNLPGHYQTREAAEEALSKLLGLPEQPQPFQTPDCPDCACVQDGQCLCTPSKPSAAPAERAPRVTDAMYHAFVDATRLQGNESETVKDLVMNGLEAALEWLPPSSDPVQTQARVDAALEALKGILPYAENEASGLHSYDDCEEEAAKASAAVLKAQEVLAGAPVVTMKAARKALITKHAELIKERDELRRLLTICLEEGDLRQPIREEIIKILPCVDEGCPQAGSEHVCTTIAKSQQPWPPKPDLRENDKYAGPGMLKDRYLELQHGDGTLTPEEIAAGWFFDDDCDGLLAHTSWPGHEKDRP